MQAQQSWLTDPTVFAVNRLDAHSDHVCYATQAEADAGVTSLRQPLDGVWRFAYSPCPAQRPADFWQEGYDLARFGTIRVPGHIELQGYGQIQYINTLYPWDGHAELCPPQIDWENTPVGSYAREFTLAPGLRGKPVCVSFQGVEQAFYLWCNGQFVGYAEDSFTPSEFELTPYLREGVNRLCVEVYKFSSAAWLEDQDMFRFSGIFRSVYLYARPALHVEDVWFMAGLARDNATGTLQVRLRLAGPARAARVQLRLGALYDGALPLTERDGFWYSPELRFAGVTPWCHETPVLYPAALTLADAEGQVCEVVPYAVGFRRFELENGVMKLNGRRVMFNGVNRHEWNPQRGRAVTAEDMTAAMQTFQRNHINAVRTSHYPNQTLWYHLCDQNGIYMIDEANLESHGTWQIRGAVDPSRNVPGDRPEWKACVVDRARSMLERDKNHPAILIWSCGNESHGGKTLWEMSEYFRNTDPSRLVHYEGIFWNREYPATSDMESQMYTPVADIKKFLAEHPEKPFIMCEYSHAMGNSCGGIADYTEYAYEEPLYQGGFIWEYMDHGIAVTSPDGKPGFAYGGDFGDRPTDREFCVDGLVLPDRRNTPKMDAVKAAYAPLKITLTDTEAVIENRNLFTDLNAYDLVFASSVNGKPERRAVLRADCKPGGTEHIPFPFALPEAGLACMTVTAIQRAALPGIPAGYEAALGQVWHNYAVARLTLPVPQLVEMDCNVGVKGDGFEYIFGRGKGLVSIRYNGVQLLDDTVRPNFWRAPTNNDEGCAEPFTFAFWKTAGLYARCDNLTAETKGDFVIARANYTLPDGQTLPIDFAIDGAGRCDITMTWQGTRTELPEFGLLFPLRRELTEVSYLGLGPRETTADRTAGGKMGAWNYNVRQDFAQNTPVYPQECGSRTGVYSATVTGSGLNIGIGFAGDGMTFSALPYTPHELENARHLYELPRDDNKTVVRCAAFQRGVGGDNSWGAKPHADACFAVEKGTSFRFTIQK